MPKMYKIQYIGETKRNLRERLKEHRQAINNPNHSNAAAEYPRPLAELLCYRHDNSFGITTQQQRIPAKI